MLARLKKITALDAYVTAVIVVGALCTLWLVLDGAQELHRLASPEAVVFCVFAFAGEFVVLKVMTRGAEGEVTTSTTFALAAMILVHPLAGLIALGSANLVADTWSRKPPQKILFNLFQYAIAVGAAGLVMEVLTGLPLDSAPHLAPSDLPGVLLAAVTFFVTNIGLV